jgi:stearoyl-CoA desaturase (delta-9 desaturase)
MPTLPVTVQKDPPSDPIAADRSALERSARDRSAGGGRERDRDRVALFTSVPFFLVHALALGAFFVRFHWWYPVVAIGLYYLRMFGITAGYHRYFSHRAYKTGRVFQFLLAWLGTTATQKGVLWWAAHHRDHHKFSDQPEDIHSPVQRGLWWSHAGWILSSRFDETKWERIPDFAKYPELRWLNRWHWVPPILLAVVLFAVGGWPLVVWGYFVSTTLLYHGTFTINSLSHVFGSRRYATTDDSRNNWALALLTMGEGWHNNHHHYQSTACQGFFWWEVDLSYYLLRGLSLAGLVWDLRTPPRHIRDNQRPAEVRPMEPLEGRPAPAPAPLVGPAM